MPTPKRGSEKLDASKSLVVQRDVSKLLERLRVHGAKIEEWWIKGQPKPDLVGGAVRLGSKSAGALIQELIETSPRLEIKIFPKGVPALDEVIVTFRSQGVR